MLSHLITSTDATSTATAEVTLALYRHFVSFVSHLPALAPPADSHLAYRSAVQTFIHTKNAEPLIAFLSAYRKPLGDLGKRSKTGAAASALTCEELAFTTLCDVLASQLGASASFVIL